MQPEFWRERWQQGQIGFHRPQVNADLRAHWPRLQCARTARVFVPLCGKSVDMAWLRAQGHTVIGIELSDVAVGAFFAEQRLEPLRERVGALERWSAAGYELYVGNFFDLGADQLGDVPALYDRAALIALPAPLRERYVRRMAALLSAGSQILLLTMDYPQQQMPGPPFAVAAAEVRRLFAPDFSVSQIASRDALLEEPRFMQRGLTSRREEAYLLQRLDGTQQSSTVG